MESRKIEQLAEFLGIEAKEIEVSEDGDLFFTPNGTYAVMDEDEAKTALQDDIVSFIYECGISGFSEGFYQEIKQDYIDNDRLEEWVREDIRNYAFDIADEESEEYVNRLVEESIEKGYISEEDLTENKGYKGEGDLAEIFAECYMNEMEEKYNGCFAECIAKEHGNYFLDGMVNADLSLIDIEQIAEASEQYDGYGHSLASWDGATNETTDFYVFKQTDGDDRTQEFLDELGNDENLEY